MPYIPQYTLEGAQEVQERNLRRIANLRPEGAAGEAVRDAAIDRARAAEIARIAPAGHRGR